ncbi:hypothetical protein LCGC14_1999630 [marine sediment metagenome]|uniref:DNA methylase N-4/N-6 domain-containing protein n=1 Tax=marine sediment metagenome TaxID=412755 RepID=A0A0F9I0P1_9ZZZZ
MTLPYYQDSYVTIYLGDCREILPELPKVDLVLTDPPYGTTACSWDTIIPLDTIWGLVLPLAGQGTPIIFTASQPFSSALVMSKPKLFRHSWIYKKRCASNFAQAKYAPMKEHEDVLVFGLGKVNYYPIKENRKGSGIERTKYKYTDKSRHASGDFVGNIKGDYDKLNDSGNDELRYPSSVQEFNNRATGDRGLHPTQKPLSLFKYLIETYTRQDDTVLDFCLGSGTTALACKKLNRKCIGIEIEEKYCEIAAKRCSQSVMELNI